MKKIHLIGTKGCGSVISEAMFILAGVPYEYEEIDYSSDGKLKKKLLKYNPLGQVPTAILPNGQVLTETVAMMIYAHAFNPQAKLVPTENAEKFWRWQIFLVSSIYPTFTFGDETSKFVSGKKAQEELRVSSDERRKMSWKMVEKEVEGPWFMGDELSAIDVFISVMSNWRPRREWFKKHYPKLYKIALKVDKDPRLLKLLKTHFTN